MTKVRANHCPRCYATGKVHPAWGPPEVCPDCKGRSARGWARSVTVGVRVAVEYKAFADALKRISATMDSLRASTRLARVSFADFAEALAVMDVQAKLGRAEFASVAEWGGWSFELASRGGWQHLRGFHQVGVVHAVLPWWRKIPAWLRDEDRRALRKACPSYCELKISYAWPPRKVWKRWAARQWRDPLTTRIA